MQQLIQLSNRKKHCFSRYFSLCYILNRQCSWFPSLIFDYNLIILPFLYCTVLAYSDFPCLTMEPFQEHQKSSVISKAVGEAKEKINCHHAYAFSGTLTKLWTVWMNSVCNQCIYLAIIPLIKCGIVTQADSSRLSLAHKTQLSLFFQNYCNKKLFLLEMHLFKSLFSFSITSIQAQLNDFQYAFVFFKRFWLSISM